jgi:hypothetical protein
VLELEREREQRMGEFLAAHEEPHAEALKRTIAEGGRPLAGVR